MFLSNQTITAIIAIIVLTLLSVLVESRSYNNGLIFYDLKSHIPYLPPTVSVSRGRVLSNVKFSTKGSIWSTFGKPCECSGAICGCCAGITVKQYKFDQKMCANVTFVPAKAEAQLDVYLNEKPSAKYVVSARNPSPFCIPVMMGIPMAMCVQMSDITIKGNNLNMCMDFVVRLASTDLFEMHFQCMQMGLDGVQYLDKNGQPVIPPSNSKISETDNYEYYDEAATADGSENDIDGNGNENENEVDKTEEIESEKVKDMEKYEELEKEVESHQQLQQLQQQLQQMQQQQEPEPEQQLEQQQQIMEQQESEISSTDETTINEDGIEINEAENEIIDAITTTADTETKIDTGKTNVDTDAVIHNSTIVDAIAAAAAIAVTNDKIAATITTTTTATIPSTVANADNDSNNSNNDNDNDNGDDYDKDNNDNNDEEDNYDTDASDSNESENDVTDENVVSTTIAAAMSIETVEATAASFDSDSTESSNEISMKLQTLTESNTDANAVASVANADTVAATDAIINSTNIAEEESSLETTVLHEADLKTRYRRLRG